MIKNEVQNIYCIGRNYAEHVKEMDYSAPTEPVIFLKPNSAISKDSFISIPEFNFKKDSITLKVNGEVRQCSKVTEMIFKPVFLIHYLSSIFRLKKGDLIFTGTPSGVSQVFPGDEIEAEIPGKTKLNILVK